MVIRGNCGLPLVDRLLRGTRTAATTAAWEAEIEEWARGTRCAAAATIVATLAATANVLQARATPEGGRRRRLGPFLFQTCPLAHFLKKINRYENAGFL